MAHRLSLCACFCLTALLTGCAGASSSYPPPFQAGSVTKAITPELSKKPKKAENPALKSTTAVSEKRSDFLVWRTGMVKTAQAKGISEKTAKGVLGHARFIPRVVELDRYQPETTKTFTEYKNMMINTARVSEGRALARAHAADLARVEATYGVPAAVIVALWGMESSYGNKMGDFKVVDALATLAYDGRRRNFYTAELIAALKILDAGHIAPDRMVGSWAGAMGQNQFMPSSFLRLAVDGNGDGRKDIWGSRADVFASSAHYLHRAGWKKGQKWGHPVRLSTTFQKTQIGLDHPRTMAEWEKAGIRLINGDKLTAHHGEAETAYLIQPGGTKGPPFLVYGNYKAIFSWNQSHYFASTVGLLADQIAQSP